MYETTRISLHPQYHKTHVSKMAESVHLVLEGMLPHLEELQYVGLFTESEIR